MADPNYNVDIFVTRFEDGTYSAAAYDNFIGRSDDRMTIEEMIRDFALSSRAFPNIKAWFVASNGATVELPVI